MGEAVYAIDNFPQDDLLGRIGGVGNNTSVPSDPQIDVCLAQPPAGEKNPLKGSTAIRGRLKAKSKLRSLNILLVTDSVIRIINRFTSVANSDV